MNTYPKSSSYLLLLRIATILIDESAEISITKTEDTRYMTNIQGTKNHRREICIKIIVRPTARFWKPTADLKKQRRSSNTLLISEASEHGYVTQQQTQKNDTVNINTLDNNEASGHGYVNQQWTQKNSTIIQMRQAIARPPGKIM